jgi:peptidoglycan/LPS O-acetylase OafA/YrhL
LGAVAADSPAELDHIRGLDGLRGVAVVMVVAHHVLIGNAQTGSRAVNFVYALIHSGWAGVDLFFVLSGFLITRILFVTQHDPHYVRNFYARRMLRIFPLYYAVLLVLAVAGPWVHVHLERVLPYYLTYTANLRPSGPIPLQDLPGGNWIISHFWSLQVEEQFYLVWPFLLALLRTRRGILLGTVAGCVLAFALRVVFTVKATATSNEYWAYAFTPCRMDSLLIGSALVMLWFSRARATLERFAAPTLAAVVLVLAVDGGLHRGLHPTGDAFMSTVGFTLLALGSSALVVLVLSRAGFRALFESAPLRWLGKYSYGIYVFHLPVSFLLTTRLHGWLLNATHMKLLSLLVAAAAVSGLTFLLAYASYQLYEKNFLRLKRHFAYRKAMPLAQPAL